MKEHVIFLCIFVIIYLYIRYVIKTNENKLKNSIEKFNDLDVISEKLNENLKYLKKIIM